MLGESNSAGDDRALPATSPLDLPAKLPVDLSSNSPERPAVARAIQRAWTRVLDPESLEVGLGFDEAGGDSLRLLKFAFYVEQELDTELPLELFSPIMRPRDVARAIARHLAGQPTLGSVAPLPIHLLPGRSRDEQRLVRFREACRASHDMHGVDYGDWSHWTERGFDANALIARIASGIAARQPSGALHLLGYSLGGYVGFATALRLREMGRDIGLLGVLDTNLAMNEQGGFRAGRHDRAVERARILQGLRQRQAAAPLAEFAARRLTGPRWAPLLRLLARQPHKRRMPGELGFYLREQLRMRMLTNFVATLRPALEQAGVLGDIPVVVFRACEQDRPAAPDLGWGHACPQLRVLPVAGGHHTMFDPPHLEGLVNTVLSEFDMARIVT